MNVSIAEMPSATSNVGVSTVASLSTVVSVAGGSVVCEGGAMVTGNVVVLAGTVTAEPGERWMPSGDEVTELRLSVPEAGKRLLPLPGPAWHRTVGKRAAQGIATGDD